MFGILSDNYRKYKSFIYKCFYEKTLKIIGKSCYESLKGGDFPFFVLRFFKR